MALYSLQIICHLPAIFVATYVAHNKSSRGMILENHVPKAKGYARSGGLFQGIPALRLQVELIAVARHEFPAVFLFLDASHDMHVVDILQDLIV